MYLIFFLSMLGAILAAAGLFHTLITVRTPDGATIKSDWPASFTEAFRNEIIFIRELPQVRQTGMVSLQENGIGLQILETSGREIYSYQKPAGTEDRYSNAALLQLYQNGRLEQAEVTSFMGSISHNGNDYVYILYFPGHIAKVTMYLNGDTFSGGKTVILLIVGILLTAVLVSGMVYGFWTTRMMGNLTASIRDIAARRYLPNQARGSFKDIYDSLNTLDTEIRASDRLRDQTETIRQEWISNITHDLKTPLSPIKGYAELLLEKGSITEEQCSRYAEIMLKNTAYLENLIDDLKLTYQLENGMLPLKRQEQNFIRFLKECAIDILNNPEYERRTIHFEADTETVLFPFDSTLFTRAFQNIMINAFVHGDEHTELTLRMSAAGSVLVIVISDNGKGMTPKETGSLFERYYRGTHTEHKPEGTGLGLAIAKSIVELHEGTISVSSIPGRGTAFRIQFPLERSA